MELNLKERKKALNAYIKHRRNVEKKINGSNDILVKLSFFIRNRVTDMFEVWRDLVKLRVNGSLKNKEKRKLSSLFQVSLLFLSLSLLVNIPIVVWALWLSNIEIILFLNSFFSSKGTSRLRK